MGSNLWIFECFKAFCFFAKNLRNFLCFREHKQALIICLPRPEKIDMTIKKKLLKGCFRTITDSFLSPWHLNYKYIFYIQSYNFIINSYLWNRTISCPSNLLKFCQSQIFLFEFFLILVAENVIYCWQDLILPSYLLDLYRW